MFKAEKKDLNDIMKVAFKQPVKPSCEPLGIAKVRNVQIPNKGATISCSMNVLF